MTKRTYMPSAPTQIPLQRKFIQLLLSWLIPGSGFLFHNQLKRGIVIFVLLSATAFFGVALKGTVVFPVWSPAKEGFNVINILTFLAQMGFGGLSLLCLLSQPLGIKFLQGQQAYAFFDLASFYLIVSGAMNYLMLFNFYDRCLRTEKGENSRTER